jgi:hypothetical protein
MLRLVADASLVTTGQQPRTTVPRSTAPSPVLLTIMAVIIFLRERRRLDDLQLALLRLLLLLALMMMICLSTRARPVSNANYSRYEYVA